MLMILSLHPAMQLLLIVLTLYVFFLGIQRFRATVLHQKAVFPWKRHVLLGEIATIFMFGGMLGGIVITHLTWPGSNLAGLHGKIGAIIGVVIIFTLGTGFYMNRVKKKRKTLPLVHAGINLVLVILVLFQIWTGVKIYKSFVLGI